MNLIASLLSGAIGGFVATFGGKVATDWWNRPILNFDTGIIRRGESDFHEDRANAEYEVEIRNTGRSVATNCKARLVLEGSRKTTEKRAESHPNGGVRDFDISIEERYTIDITRNWNESTSPTRIDLNREEHSRFDLFWVNSERVGAGVNTDITFGERTVANQDGVREISRSEPIRVESNAPEANFEPLVSTEHQISKEIFEEIEWDTKKVIVTSADADKIEGELHVSWDGTPLPDVEIT